MAADDLRAAAAALDTAAAALDTMARQVRTVLPEASWHGPAAGRFQAESLHTAATVVRAAAAARAVADGILARALTMETAGRMPVGVA